MIRSCPASILAVLTVFLGPAALRAADAPTAAPAPEAGRIEAAPAPAAGPPAREFAYGPILSRDPAVRGAIKKLYRDQWDYNVAADGRIAELQRQLGGETDPDVREALSHDAMQLKREIEIRNVEFGLEIARLNEDPDRVAEFERALDALLQPELYRPAPLDPSIAEQRARDLGLK